MSDARGGARSDNDRPGIGASIDELVDHAVSAINRGDRATAAELAGQVLALDSQNPDAEDLLAAPTSPGEIRRLTILVADLVDSTVLSNRVEPEVYRTVVGRYRERVIQIVERYEGHVGSVKGDGVLAVFGHPRAHEDDARRAVQVALEITREVARLSQQAQRQFGIELAVRVGVHRGLVYLDTAQDDVYGLAANLAARVSTLAPPGSVAVSDAVETLVRDAFEFEARTPTPVKGVDEPIAYHLVLGEQPHSARVGMGRGPMVGRQRELARLQKSWARAQAGTLSSPGLVFRGEPGVGKSRLAAAAATLADDSGAVVLELIGSPFHTDAGLHPVRTLLERRCGINRATEAGERLRLLRLELAAQSLDAQHVVPLLAPVIGIPSDAGYEPVAAEGRKLYELIATGVRDYLLACFGGGAGLLIAEDLHWFDPSTKETVAWLLGASVGRLLVVITGRPGEWLPNEWPVKVFDLQPLTGEQADSLITALGPDLSPEDRAAVRLRSDGLPLYIEQLVRGLADEPADSSAETRVPDALYEPLFARLRARADVVPIVEAAGIIGRHVDRGLLSTVCAMSEDDVDDIIDELEDALVLEPWGIDGWRFRHELLREVAAELAPPSVSRALHRKVADALVQGIDGGDPDWRLVASHYEQAERFDESVWAYRQAASAARRRGAVAEARTDLSLALSALDRAKPGPDRDRRELAVRLERGFLVATVEGYHSRAAIDDFDRCLQLSGTDPCRDEFVATTVALIGYHFTRADLRQLVEGFEALQASLQQGRPWLHPVIEAGFGVVTCVRGDFDTPTAHIEGAISSLTAASREQIMAVWGGPNDPIVTATLHLVLTRFVQGDLTGAEATLGQVAGLVEGLGFPQGPFTRAYTQFMEAWMRIEAGQLDRAAELDTDLMGQAERHGFDIWLLWAGTQLAAVRALAEIGAQETDLSKLAEQASIMANLIGALRSVGAEIYVTMFDSLLARVLIAMGETDRARDRIDAALALAENSGSHFYDAELLRLRAATHADPDACRADIAAALELARRQGATLFELRAALDDFRLRGESARTEIIDAVGRLPADSAFPELAQAQPLCRQ